MVKAIWQAPIQLLCVPVCGSHCMHLWPVYVCVYVVQHPRLGVAGMQHTRDSFLLCAFAAAMSATQRLAEHFKQVSSLHMRGECQPF